MRSYENGRQLSILWGSPCPDSYGFPAEQPPWDLWARWINYVAWWYCEDTWRSSSLTHVPLRKIRHTWASELSAESRGPMMSDGPSTIILSISRTDDSAFSGCWLGINNSILNSQNAKISLGLQHWHAVLWSMYNLLKPRDSGIFILYSFLQLSTYYSTIWPFNYLIFLIFEN